MENTLNSEIEEIADDDELRAEEAKKAERIMQIMAMIVLILAMIGLGAILGGILNLATNYFHKRTTQEVYQVATTIDDLKEKNIVVKLHVPDNVKPETVEDDYIATLIRISDSSFEAFFKETFHPLQENITIFFIDQKYWDGEKVCSWNESGGCNINDGNKNIIFIPLSYHLVDDLQTLNHERTHAYFLREPEIVAQLVQNLFANNNDLSGKSFELYKDSQERLRFMPSSQDNTWSEFSGRGN